MWLIAKESGRSAILRICTFHFFCRMDLMKAASHLYGADLQKCLTESITKTRLERQTFTVVVEGTAKPFNEAEAKWMEKDPTIWEKIKKNATTFACPVTQKVMINANPVLHRGSLPYIYRAPLIKQLVRSVCAWQRFEKD